MGLKRTICIGAIYGLLLPGAVRAEGVNDATRRAARNLGVAGVEAFEAQDYATASEKLDKAYRTLKAPSLGLWSARALVKLNKLIEAAERYQEVVRLEISGGDRAVQLQAQTDAAAELERLSPQIPNVIVEVTGVADESVKVTLDGLPLASPLIGERGPVNPGKHRVRGTSGTQTAEAEVMVSVGETKSVELRFVGQTAGANEPAHAASAAAPPDTRGATPPADRPRVKSYRRTLGFAGLGVGGAGLALGGIAFGVALDRKKSIDASPDCYDNRCLRTETDLVSSYSTWRTVSGIGIIGGLVFGAAGVALLLGAPTEAAQTVVAVTPGSLAVSRTF